MSLSIGIVGLPNVGKSTLFNALTKNKVPAENYPFCTIDPSVGIVPVPDGRLYALSTLSKSKKTVPAVVQFVDIAGLVKGAAEGEGLGNQFLSHIREVDAICEVVRIFEDPDIIHVHGGIDPLHDIEIINLELSLKDLETVKKRLSGVERDVRAGDKKAVIEKSALGKLSEGLSAGKLAKDVGLSEEEQETIDSLHLLTSKPFLYVLNKKTGAKNLDEVNDDRFKKLIEFFEKDKVAYVILDAGLEFELNEFDPKDKESFKRDAGHIGEGLPELITKSYDLLGLETFFTTGEDETRGWTIKKESTAKEAGAAIHTDFRDRFIRAEVIFWKDLINVGSYAEARKKGLVRTEGKEYIVKDGDVIEFKIGV